MSKGQHSKTGVWVAADFRDNLIIDRYDPMFAGMRASKIKHLRSANSEDALTWNVFRSLRQIDPANWLPDLFRSAFEHRAAPPSTHATVELWQSVPPPPSLVLLGDEGESEVDIVIDAPDWVWFIEAKLGSDVSQGTTTRPDRDQVLRNVDVGSWYAGVRPFYFSLLIRDGSSTPNGVALVAKYAQLSATRELLAGHRPDGLVNLHGVSLLRWDQVAEVLRAAQESAARPAEASFASRALEWLRERGIARGAG